MIVTVGHDMALAAKRATSTVPIVLAVAVNPVEAGVVASLARPGGNITGFTFHAGPEIEAKRLQLLKEAVPEATRVAFLGTEERLGEPGGEERPGRAPDAGHDASSMPSTRPRISPTLSP